MSLLANSTSTAQQGLHRAGFFGPHLPITTLLHTCIKSHATCMLTVGGDTAWQIGRWFEGCNSPLGRWDKD